MACHRPARRSTVRLRGQQPGSRTQLPEKPSSHSVGSSPSPTSGANPVLARLIPKLRPTCDVRLRHSTEQRLVHQLPHLVRLTEAQNLCCLLTWRKWVQASVQTFLGLYILPSLYTLAQGPGSGGAYHPGLNSLFRQEYECCLPQGR